MGGHTCGPDMSLPCPHACVCLGQGRPSGPRAPAKTSLPALAGARGATHAGLQNTAQRREPGSLRRSELHGQPPGPQGDLRVWWGHTAGGGAQRPAQTRSPGCTRGALTARPASPCAAEGAWTAAAGLLWHVLGSGKETRHRRAGGGGLCAPGSCSGSEDGLPRRERAGPCPVPPRGRPGHAAAFIYAI